MVPRFGKIGNGLEWALGQKGLAKQISNLPEVFQGFPRLVI